MDNNKKQPVDAAFFNASFNTKLEIAKEFIKKERKSISEKLSLYPERRKH